jgi:adenylosuccinate lyase
MPQKRNPERSEHLVTLARVVRAAADPALEGLVSEHERDGAAWKAEWAFLPQACGAAAAALSLAVELVGGLRVDGERMRANLDAQRGYVLAEAVMLGLSERVGKDRAYTLVAEAAARGVAEGVPFRDALLADREIGSLLAPAAVDDLLRPERSLGAIDELIGRVIE